MTINRINNYLDLLKVRQKGERRNLTILGGIFFLALIALIAFGLLDRLNGRSVYLTTSLVFVLGLGYLNAWVKYLVTSRNIELLDNLSF